VAVRLPFLFATSPDGEGITEHAITVDNLLFLLIFEGNIENSIKNKIISVIELQGG